ncbi:glycosyltransferase [Knoellia locipacati]|uniref:glycosyltransferase n=1 Tax=Knoellia locipacati TaxID=882824 RepID=UPI0011BFA2E0|nr:glycosyltransferase [Knoellia locipacati]
MDVTCATTTLDLLDEVRTAPTLLAGIELFDALADEVRRCGDDAESALAEALADERDQLTAIAAVHAAAAGGPSMAQRLVVPLLGCEVAHLREHAAWALRSCPPLPDALPQLHAMAGTGGFTGVLAEATLEAWGFGDEDDVVTGPVPQAEVGRGLTVAQLFLHADIDGSLQQSGKGDTGGIATLLVHLGDALVEDPRVERVVTLSRSRADGRLPDDLTSPGHHYVGVPLPGPVRSAAEAWPLRVPVRAGLRRALRAAAPVDVLHLRMADVGSWVAADVARELGIPTVLTLAPDPHALVAAREASGSLTRSDFGAADLVEHLVFRVRLLRDLAGGAAGLVAFPRTHFERDLRTLLHIDPDERSVVVVPEGIDLGPLDRAAEQVAAAAQGLPVPSGTTRALGELDTLLATLPPERRGLPLAVTVGRMHRVKGMATLVQAWADEPAFATRCNLLVVGGDLDDPSGDEAEQLALIDRAVPGDTSAERGLLLAGHRPNGTVATWLAAVQAGRPGLCAPGGVYVSASLKEEFGIAILEALASGLVVVAPQEGGPATYVDDGVTGFLVDTTSPTRLAAAVVSALDLASGPDASVRAEKARAAVAHDFGIATMATSLARVYAEVAR